MNHEYRHGLLNDRFIAEAVFPGLTGGYFVEAGAVDGVHQSAAYVLETDLQWTGICVEPVPFYYERLIRTRSCATDDRCLWNETGQTVEFAMIPDDLARSGVQTVNKTLNRDVAGSAVAQAEQEYRVELRASAIDPIAMKTVTLHDLLTEHDAPETIHYLAMDIEGVEPIVLEAFDFDGPHKILAISIEGDDCDEIMERAGYTLVRNRFEPIHIDRHFVHPDLAAERPDLVAAPSP